MYEYSPDHIRLVTEIRLFDAERIRIEDFFREVQNLDESSWVRGGMKAGLTISIGASDEVEMQFRDWEQIQAVLIRLRPLILQEESANFESIRKIIFNSVYKQLGKEVAYNFKRAVKYQTRGFEGSSAEEGVSVNGTLNISSRSFLMNYLYSEEFHRNAVTRASIEPAMKMPKKEIQGFLSITIFHIVNSIHTLRDIIRHVVDEETRKILE